MEQKRGRGRQGGVSCKDGPGPNVSLRDSAEQLLWQSEAGVFVAFCTHTLTLACHVKIKTKTRPGSEV